VLKTYLHEQIFFECTSVNIDVQGSIVQIPSKERNKVILKDLGRITLKIMLNFESTAKTKYEHEATSY
jgi:hypothetical protein